MTMLTKEEWEELIVDVRSHLLPRKQAEVFDQIVERLGSTLPTYCVMEPGHVVVSFETARSYLDVYFDTDNGEIEWLWERDSDIKSSVRSHRFSDKFWEKLNEFIGTKTPEVIG